MSSSSVTIPSLTATTLQPYLFFGGRGEEAIAFYRQAAGADVEMMMRFNPSSDPVPAGMPSPGFEDKIIQSSLRIAGNGISTTRVMGERRGAQRRECASLAPDEMKARRKSGSLV